MKKWFTLCMAVLLLLGVFAGCTKGGSGGETTTAETTTSPLETKSAAITGNTAIRLLESYSKKELGLDNVGKKKYEFMLSTIGSEIKGKKYIRAEAGYMDQTGKDENGKPVYQMKSYKTFYIAYDGKTLLIDQGDGKYKTLQIDKARLDQVTTTQASTQKHESTSKKKQSTNTQIAVLYRRRIMDFPQFCRRIFVLFTSIFTSKPGYFKIM